MSLEDQINAAIDDQIRRSPVGWTTEVDGPALVSMETMVVWTDLQQTKNELIDLARKFDRLINQL